MLFDNQKFGVLKNDYNELTHLGHDLFLAV